MRGLSIPFNRWTHRAKELKHPDLGQDTAEAGFQLQADFKGLSGSPGSRMALYPPPVPPAWTPGSLSTRQNLGSSIVAVWEAWVYRGLTGSRWVAHQCALVGCEVCGQRNKLCLVHPLARAEETLARQAPHHCNHLCSTGLSHHVGVLTHNIACFIEFILANRGMNQGPEMAPHSSSLAWKIPWTEEPGRLQPMGSQRVGHQIWGVFWRQHHENLQTEWI